MFGSKRCAEALQSGCGIEFADFPLYLLRDKFSLEVLDEESRISIYYTAYTCRVGRILTHNALAFQTAPDLEAPQHLVLNALEGQRQMERLQQRPQQRRAYLRLRQPWLARQSRFGWLIKWFFVGMRDISRFGKVVAINECLG